LNDQPKSSQGRFASGPKNPKGVKTRGGAKILQKFFRLHFDAKMRKKLLEKSKIKKEKKFDIKFKLHMICIKSSWWPDDCKYKGVGGLMIVNIQ
jgi:hypothetical protein